MVGLRMGPIKQELSRQIRRNEHMTFEDIYRVARALEVELQEGEDLALSQRVTAPTPRNDAANLEQLKSQLRAELQQGLMGEVKEQIKSLSTCLMEEIKTQLATATRELRPAPGSRPLGSSTASTSAPPVRPRKATAPTYQWDAEGRPICRRCGEAGHVQRRCPHRPSVRRDF